MYFLIRNDRVLRITFSWIWRIPHLKGEGGPRYRGLCWGRWELLWAKQ